MAHIIRANDGTNHILMNFSDFTDLVEETIGIEAVEWLFEFLSDTYGEESEIDAVIEECEKDLQEQKEKYKNTMAEIRVEAEKLAGLICQKDLDRKAISNTAGRIGAITWREVNRP